MPNIAINSSSVVWVCLPHLPTKFYDLVILQKLGNSIGILLKVDAWTSATLRGPYARLFVEIDLLQPFKPHIIIESHLQIIEYKMANLLSAKCGMIGTQHQYFLCQKH